MKSEYNKSVHIIKRSKHTWSSNTMEVSFSVLREVEVDDNVDSLYVNTSGEEIYRKTVENWIIISDNLCAFLENTSWSVLKWR